MFYWPVVILKGPDFWVGLSWVLASIHQTTYRFPIVVKVLTETRKFRPFLSNFWTLKKSPVNGRISVFRRNFRPFWVTTQLSMTLFRGPRFLFWPVYRLICHQQSSFVQCNWNQLGVFVSASRGGFSTFYKQTQTRTIATIFVKWPRLFSKRGEKSPREVKFPQKQIPPLLKMIHCYTFKLRLLRQEGILP